MLSTIEFGILDFIQKIESPFMDKLMIFFTTIGDAGMIWVAISAILLISKKTRYIGFIALVSLLFTEIFCNQVLKNIVQRERPYTFIEGYELLISKPRGYSFPSGHVTASFSVAFVYWKYFKNRYAILAMILASLISFSRMYIYVHFPTDIIAGIILGFLNAYLAILLFDTYKKRQERQLGVR